MMSKKDMALIPSMHVGLGVVLLILWVNNGRLLFQRIGLTILSCYAIYLAFVYVYHNPEGGEESCGN